MVAVAKLGNGYTPQQEAFIQAMVETGSRNASECARIAGYSETCAAQRASELLKRPEVLEEIKNRTEQALKASVPNALKVLIELMNDTSISASVRKDCATTILDRGGLRYVERKEIVINNLDPEERRRLIAEYQADLEILHKTPHKPIKTIEGDTKREPLAIDVQAIDTEQD